jgi:hypothetical protein
VIATLIRTLGCIEFSVCIAVLCSIVAKKQWEDYWALGSFLGVRAVSTVMLAVLEILAKRSLQPGPLPGSLLPTGISHVYYKIYFYVYWSSFAIESILALIAVYCIFRLAMAPLKGLQSLGMLVFRWAAAISVAVALGSAFAPHQTSAKYLVAAVTELQRTQSILTLCLLLFVCFAIRPMGLSFSSRIFGVSLGLGMMATANLVQTAWFGNSTNMADPFDVVNGIVVGITMLTWAGYFALPEPKRRIIVLPTTSPFLRWNQISQALGDEPGYVAVGGIPPELFSPAELEVMRRASAKMPAASAPATASSYPESLGRQSIGA